MYYLNIITKTNINIILVIKFIPLTNRKRIKFKYLLLNIVVIFKKRFSFTTVYNYT